MSADPSISRAAAETQPAPAKPAPTGTTILVVDDDENIAYLVAAALRLDQHHTITAANGRDALATIETADPDLVVLDINLPDLDGLTVLHHMRRDGHQQPVVFLTARASPADRIRGLTAGADDYVTKPFSIEELLTRVRVVLRRAGVSDPATPLRYGGLEMDEERHLVRRAGREIHLTLTEYRLLRFLLLNAEVVVTKQVIIDHVWNHDIDDDSTVVETFISHLRRKVDVDDPPLIHTIRGVGYSLRDASPPEPR